MSFWNAVSKMIKLSDEEIERIAAKQLEDFKRTLNKGIAMKKAIQETLPIMGVGDAYKRN